MSVPELVSVSELVSVPELVSGIEATLKIFTVFFLFNLALYDDISSSNSLIIFIIAVFK